MTILCTIVVMAALFITVFNSNTSHQVQSSEKAP
jgi:hypothetical protein